MAVWLFLGFFYTVLLLGRVAMYVGVRLLGNLFSQGKPIDLSGIIGQPITVYADGFRKIRMACFGFDASEQDDEILSIGSLYELLATIFVIYLASALVFPRTFLPDLQGLQLIEITRDCSECEGSVDDDTPTADWGMGLMFLGVVLIAMFLAAIIVTVYAHFFGPRLTPYSLKTALLEEIELSSDDKENIADRFGVTVQEIEDLISKEREK